MVYMPPSTDYNERQDSMPVRSTDSPALSKHKVRHQSQPHSPLRQSLTSAKDFPHNSTLQGGECDIPVLQGVAIATTPAVNQSRTIKMSLPLVNQTATFNIGDTETSHIETPANPIVMERDNLLLQDDDSSLSSERASMVEEVNDEVKDTPPIP